MLTALAKLMDHPAFSAPPPPCVDDIPDVEARRAALWKRRQEIEAAFLHTKGDENSHFHWTMTLLLRTIKYSLKLTGLWARGRRNARQVHLREVTWSHPALPHALDGLTLLHLADFHYRRGDAKFAEAVRTLLAGVEVDLCLMTGDYRFGHLGPFDHVQQNLEALFQKMTVRHGSFAILGNHDVTPMASAFPDIGVRLLYNEGVEVRIRDTPVWIGGTEDSHIMRSSDVQAALHGRPEERFTILLSHTPEDIDIAERSGCDVYLCGHTHGGQIRLPLWGPVISNAACAREHKHGVWRVGNMFGNTSAGLGTTDLPVRYNCPAEAHLITLRCG